MSHHFHIRAWLSHQTNCHFTIAFPSRLYAVYRFRNVFLSFTIKLIQSSIQHSDTRRRTPANLYSKDTTREPVSSPPLHSRHTNPGPNTQSHHISSRSFSSHLQCAPNTTSVIHAAASSIADWKNVCSTGRSSALESGGRMRSHLTSAVIAEGRRFDAREALLKMLEIGTGRVDY